MEIRKRCIKCKNDLEEIWLHIQEVPIDGPVKDLIEMRTLTHVCHDKKCDRYGLLAVPAVVMSGRYL